MWREHCLLCGMGSAQAAICDACEVDLRWSIDVCRRCSLPLPDDWKGSVCGRCILNPPVFSACVSACSYQYPVNRLIARYKYGAQDWLARGLSMLLTNRLRDLFSQHELPRPDVIVPVPLHHQRMRQRGFNQAYALARLVAKDLGLPLANNLCVRQLATREQTGLSEHERRSNLRGAFALRKIIAYQQPAIIDDVITTGSTVSELARVLLDGGAQSVQCWSVARAVY
ncbi:MAG: double zinc ribbon domain-containing protein [Gammaproteobacteria bacterium]